MYVCVYPTLCNKWDVTQGQILKPIWIQSFPSPKLVTKKPISYDIYS